MMIEAPGHYDGDGCRFPSTGHLIDSNARTYRAARARIVGHINDYETVWSWISEPAPNLVAAGVEGAVEEGSDDFVLVELVGGAITRAFGSDGLELADWGPDDLAEIAGCFGLRVAEATTES